MYVTVLEAKKPVIYV